MEEKQYKYDAFISYRHCELDKFVAENLHKALETYELDKKMLEYSISQYRVVPEYVKICEAFCVGLSSIQNGVDYLSDMIDLNKAEGIWLDNIGQLVGQTRSQMIDTDQFFCVNAEDVNKLKRFYFPSLSDRNGGVSDLSDNLFYGQIKAKIAYNISDGTRESNIKIIKQMVNMITNIFFIQIPPRSLRLLGDPDKKRASHFGTAT